MSFFLHLERRASYIGVKGVSGYRKYRDEIAEDCQYRCVYCDSRAVDIGGDPCMELDHFRPHSIFEHLKTDPMNLVLACRSCNGKKSNDWPAGDTERTHINGQGYIDPFGDYRGDYFKVNESGEIEPIKPPAHYMVIRLGLNRSLLRGLRKRAILWKTLTNLIDDLQQSVEMAKNNPNESNSLLLHKLSIFLEMSKEMHSLNVDPEGNC